MKGGDQITSGSEKYQALNYALDSVSRRMATYILKSPNIRMIQYTSDGIAGPREFYGIEHYGRDKRNQIRLKRTPVAAIVSITDNDTLLTSDQYVVYHDAGIIYRNVGKFFRQYRAVQVVYTAGYPSNGLNGDALALVVPEDLRDACSAQVTYEFFKREPGGIPPGATTISRPDGSVLVPLQPWLDTVKDVMQYYRNR